MSATDRMSLVMTILLYRLGRAAVRHRRRVLAGWVVLAIVVVAASLMLGGSTRDSFDVPGVESQQALDVLEERFPSAAGASAQLVFVTDDGTLSDAAESDAVATALADV